MSVTEDDRVPGQTVSVQHTGPRAVDERDSRLKEFPSTRDCDSTKLVALCESGTESRPEVSKSSVRDRGRK